MRFGEELPEERFENREPYDCAGPNFAPMGLHFVLQ